MPPYPAFCGGSGTMQMVKLAMKLCECGCGQPTNLITKANAARGLVRGEFRRFVRRHIKRQRQDHVYGSVTYNGRCMNVHRARAEKALGRPLPKGVDVHHADGSKSNDAPLVICTRSYHRLLHSRMKLRDLGGNPNTEKRCFDCKSIKLKAEFHKNKTQSDGLSSCCKSCANVRSRHYAALARAERQ